MYIAQTSSMSFTVSLASFRLDKRRADASGRDKHCHRVHVAAAFGDSSSVTQVTALNSRHKTPARRLRRAGSSRCLHPGRRPHRTVSSIRYSIPISALRDANVVQWLVVPPKKLSQLPTLPGDPPRTPVLACAQLSASSTFEFETSINSSATAFVHPANCLGP
jgi:hypothetical protein